MAEQLQQQFQLQRSIERSLDNFKKIGRNNFTPAKVRSRISSLRDLWRQFQLGHAVLVKTIPEGNQKAMDYFKDNKFDHTEEAFQTTIDYMSEVLEELEPPISPNNEAVSFHNRSTLSSVSLAQLPPIQLPPFSGTFAEWEQFRDRFTSLIIKNPDLSDFARMHFLTSCLKGRALECIGNLPVTSANFEIAWKTLSARFENKSRLLNLHLSTLLNLTVLSRESAADLQLLRDKVTIAVASLKHLSYTPAELWEHMLVHIVAEHLDPITRKAWKLKTNDSSDPPSLEALNKFITCRVRALEELSVSTANKANSKGVPIPKVSVAVASASEISQCPICKSRHYFSACPSFVRESPNQRHELVKKHGRCFNCLSRNHSVAACKSKYSCRICYQRHHTMLHVSSGAGGGPLTESSLPCRSKQAVEAKSEVQSLFVSQTNGKHVQVLLATAWVTVGVATGRSVKVRALLDQGSEMTFISENLAQLLRAPRFRMPTSVSAVGCVHAGTYQYAAKINIIPIASRTPVLSTSALILNSLTSYAPPHKLHVASLSYLADLHWADPDPASSNRIDIIIGADLYSDVILEGLRKGASGEPIAQNSIFGWVISGPVGATLAPFEPGCDSVASHNSIRVTVHHSSASLSLETEIRRFWEIEEPPSRPSLLSPEDIKCEKHFLSTILVAQTGGIQSACRSNRTLLWQLENLATVLKNN